MRKFLVLATVALGFVFTACDDEDNLNSSVLIGNKSGSNVIVQLDTLYLDARAENLSGTMEYLWTVDGKEVSTASTYKFSQPKRVCYRVDCVGWQWRNSSNEYNCQGRRSVWKRNFYFE